MTKPNTTRSTRFFSLSLPCVQLSRFAVVTVVAALALLTTQASLYSQTSDYIWRPFGQGIYGATVQAFGFAPNGNVIAGTTIGLYVLPHGESQWQKTTVGVEVQDIGTTDAGTLLAGTVLGTFRSTDNGVTWKFVFNISGQIHFVSTGNGTVFAAQDGAFGPPSYYYKSTDDGETWSTIWLLDVISRDSWMTINHKRELLFSSGSGLLISRNNGKTWDSIDFTPWIYYLFSPSPGLLLATTHEGVWQSTDGGTNWQQIDTLEFQDMRVAPNGDYYYRSTKLRGNFDTFNAFSNQGIYRSTDKGVTRTKVLPDRSPTSMGVAPDGTIWVGTRSTILRSTNNGAAWETLDSGITNTNIPLLARSFSDDLFALVVRGTHPGDRDFHALYRSSDNGTTWQWLRDSLDGSLLMPGPNTTLFAGKANIVWQPNSDGDLMNNTTVALLRSPDRGVTWEQVEANGSFTDLAMNSSGTIAASFRTENFGFNYLEGDVAFSRDGGESWHRLTEPGAVWESTPESKPAYTIAVLPDNSILFSVIVVRDSVFQEGGLYRITPTGQLQTMDTTMEFADLATAPDGTVLAVAAKLSRPAQGGPPQQETYGIYRSTDNGTTWSLALSTNLFSGYSTFQFGENGLTFVDFEGVGYRSENSGETWTPMMEGPVYISPVHMQFHPSGSIFGNAQSTVFYSLDAGKKWSRIENGLPWPGARSLILAGNDQLLGGTQAHGLYKIGSTSSVQERGSETARRQMQVLESGEDTRTLYMQIDSPGMVSVGLYDLLGRNVAPVFSQVLQAGEHRVPLNLSGLTAGTYLLLMNGPDGFISTKIQIR